MHLSEIYRKRFHRSGIYHLAMPKMCRKKIPPYDVFLNSFQKWLTIFYANSESAHKVSCCFSIRICTIVYMLWIFPEQICKSIQLVKKKKWDVTSSCGFCFGLPGREWAPLNGYILEHTSCKSMAEIWEYSLVLLNGGDFEEQLGILGVVTLCVCVCMCVCVYIYIYNIHTHTHPPQVPLLLAFLTALRCLH